MAQTKKVVKKANPYIDLNKDGKFDKEDKKIAATALATKSDTPIQKKEILKEESVCLGREAIVDISLEYRKGCIVPQKQIDKWLSMGIDISKWFEWNGA